MTTIVGVQGDKGCLLAADSRTTTPQGRPYTHPQMPKIVERDGYLIACSGDADACDIIQYIWGPPKPDNKVKDMYLYMITVVAPSIRDSLEESSYERDTSDKDSGLLVLLAYKGVIYEIDESFNVSLRDDGIYGIGSGSRYAIGALHAGSGWERALEIAAANDIYTAAPFIMKQQKKI